MIEDKKTFILKLRRFSLTIGLILFAYSRASIQLKTPAEISPLGIPLIIQNPNAIGFALFLASLYAFFRYLYYAVLIGPFPSQVRKGLLKGYLPDGTPCNSQDDKDLLRKYLLEYFPKIGKYKIFEINRLVPIENGIHITIKKIPWPVKFFCWLEDIDYFAPLWINVIAIIFFFI